MIPFIRTIWRALAIQVSTFKEVGKNEMDAGFSINRTSMLVLFLTLFIFTLIGMILNFFLSSKLSNFNLFMSNFACHFCALVFR